MSKWNTWLEFLQRQLSALKIDDPYEISNLQSLVDLPCDYNAGNLCAVSINIKRSLILATYNEQVESVKVYVTQHRDEMQYHSCGGLTVELFLELIMF